MSAVRTLAPAPNVSLDMSFGTRSRVSEKRKPTVNIGALLSALETSVSFQKLVSILSNPPHEGPMEIGGLWGSSYAYIFAALYKKLKRPMLAIVPTEREAEETASDLETFLAQPPLLFAEYDTNNTNPWLLASNANILAQMLAAEAPYLAVCSAQTFLQPLPSPETFARQKMTLRVGSLFPLQAWLQSLLEQKFERVSQVELPGQFAVRGSIADVFPYSLTQPLRIELAQDTIESLRFFDVATQVSAQTMREITFYNVSPSFFEFSSRQSKALSHYLASQSIVLLKDYALVSERVQHRTAAGDTNATERFQVSLKSPEHTYLLLNSLPVSERALNVNFPIASLQRFSGMLANIGKELEDLARECEQVYVFCANAGEQERLAELLAPCRTKPQTLQGVLNGGFLMRDLGCAFIPHHELFNRYRLRHNRWRKIPTQPLDSFLELEEGDYVVHLHHGIGRFLRIEKLFSEEHRGGEQEFLALEYHSGAKLYVPVSNIELVHKYIGGTEHLPPLSKLGGTAWNNTKKNAQQAVEDLSRGLLEIQALREVKGGIAYPSDTEWQKEFDAAFPYVETEDQIKVAEEIRSDMAKPKAMDRLVCGDVGYGKTELAMRAAFKAALANKQTAVLVPTTILAQQHYQTFRERMADYPVVVEVLSRFKSQGEQKKILEALAEGKIDIVIGTHRLLQSDVQFKDLGLVIIDEEQRFGVEHKERLKKLRATVDVLTLTATPIPRTLHMTLLGIKDVSTLTTPPQERLAVHTEVCLYDEAKIRQAILFEVERGGQVYFVHNRVQTIHEMARKLEQLVPEVTMGVAHGQMDEGGLEQTMSDFLARKIDVLVTTTIIESGVDIPNVNTLIVHNADQFGLADLHQLRGRVGRYTYQAYAYFLIPRDRPILPEAQKRLKAIEEFSELGAGFKIALRDMEIRGVGNILGKEQHGHILAVGYELYSKLLAQAVKKARREKVEEPIESSVTLHVDAYIPETLVQEPRARVELYRKINRCTSPEELERLRSELRNQLGMLPSPLENFFKLMRLKMLARAYQIVELVEGEKAIVARAVSSKTVEVLQRKWQKRIRKIDGQTFHIVRSNEQSSTLPVLDDLIEVLS